ncbi:signal peptidase I [Paenibacillus sp. 1011MAR3C5]|uniref:signal peptidase I n=1 Tax=Paenibacillus sp. 1011MAR3C5 TaxID=1675787 RepID=UPI000E6D1710|nr:signal peptidase I [Paenibacillus sp. 1011MAR3C5]RJE86842.1 signal peptidase I [Paenibacillus sp. 1011MAR3C5]
MEQEQTKPKGSRWLKEIKDWTLSLGIAIVVALLFQNYVYAQTEVHNVSMQNTLVEGQRLIEDKWSYHFNNPKHGDIVIINGPEHDGRLVKRIIALPGQTVDMKDGYVYVDGVKLEETYAKGLTYPDVVEIPFTVPEGHVFVMGDNRERSLDSRAFGAVSLDSLEGKAVYRIWPLGKFGGLQ